MRSLLLNASAETSGVMSPQPGAPTAAPSRHTQRAACSTARSQRYRDVAAAAASAMAVSERAAAARRCRWSSSDLLVGCDADESDDGATGRTRSHEVHASLAQTCVAVPCATNTTVLSHHAHAPLPASVSVGRVTFEVRRMVNHPPGPPPQTNSQWWDGPLTPHLTASAPHGLRTSRHPTHLTPPHATSRHRTHLTPPHATSRHLMPPHAT